MKIPVIINNRNLLTWTKAMVDKIKTYDDVDDIIIIDNNSTYLPLLEWYKTLPCTIIYLSENGGHFAPWNSGTVSKLNSQYYVVTDPDLGIDDTPKNSLTFLVNKMQELKLNKLGFGLDKDLVLPHHPYYNHMRGWEDSRYANSRFENDVYLDVQIDTTFAMYSEPNYFIGGGSTVSPYIAKHYPWYMTKEDVQNNPEFLYYMNNASSSATCKAFLL